MAQTLTQISPSKVGDKGGKMPAAVKAYCVKCKAKREMKNPKAITMKNKRKAMKGTCPKCGTGMFRIGG